MTNQTIHRRGVLQRLAASAGLPYASLSWMHDAKASVQGNRLIVVVLRGGLDGLAAVAAPGDPAFAEARGALAQTPTPVLPLAGGLFALHPNLTALHGLFSRGEALAVHAVGLPYRERSHFDAQQVLESGGVRPYELSTGWLARALQPQGQRGMALSTAVPLVLRGAADVDSWAPSALPEPSSDLVARLLRMYAEDPALGQALARAKGLRESPAMAAMSAAEGASGGSPVGAGRQAVLALFKKAAEFAAQPQGPQAVVLEMGGWDSHAAQAAPQGALANNLALLDSGLAQLRDGLSGAGKGDAWSRTAVLVVTEFGREVAINGTLGTDHGTGGVALVLGGAVRGGHVLADWPGLAKHQRHEGRDLRITTDLRAVFKALLAGHLHVPAVRLEREVFPGSAHIKALDLLRT
jgi:uncharacterized protein (DUF1501 family)